MGRGWADIQYLYYLKDSFLIEEALRYDVKGRKYIGTETKYYFADIGIRAAILNYRQQEETHIMENIIYNELRSRGYNVDVGLVELGGKDENGKIVIVGDDIHRKEDELGVLTVGLLDFLTDKNLLEQG